MPRGVLANLEKNSGSLKQMKKKVFKKNIIYLPLVHLYIDFPGQVIKGCPFSKYPLFSTSDKSNKSDTTDTFWHIPVQWQLANSLTNK